MSAGSTALALNEIQATRSTGLSLNERFTKITKNKLIQAESDKNARASSLANQLLLQKLRSKHKMEAALKLKRRSLRKYGNLGGQLIRRGTVKAIRVGANGKPIRMNSLTTIATMKADYEMTNRRRPMRRSNSSSRLTGRLGPRRPVVGGAAERVTLRRLQRQGSFGGGRSELYLNNANVVAASANRGRSRSRSLVRGSGRVQTRRSRSRSTVRNTNNNNINSTNNRRSRSRTRNNVPIKARLGIRPGAFNNNKSNNNVNKNQNRRNNRNVNTTKRGVIGGRIQKARSKNAIQNNIARTMGGRGRNARSRGRSAVRNNLNDGNVSKVHRRSRSRSRSRARKNQGQVGQQNQKQQRTLNVARRNRQQQSNGRRQGNARGRSQNRRSNSTNRFAKRNSRNLQSQQQQKQQQRKSRSRSRSRNRVGRGNNKGNQIPINKDELDKELDQYMATTKTENNMDYLLKH